MFSSASFSSSRPVYCSIVSIGAKNHILHSYYSSEERENEIKTQTLTKSHVLDGWSEIEMEWAIANLIIYLAAAARRRTSNCNQGIHTKMLLFKIEQRPVRWLFEGAMSCICNTIIIVSAIAIVRYTVAACLSNFVAFYLNCN